MILKLTNINDLYLDGIEDDVVLNKNLTRKSSSNMYEILFDSDNFLKITNIVLEKIKEIENNQFDVYIKNMWGYHQSESNDKLIYIPNYVKDEIFLNPEYSFILMIKSNETTFQIKKENNLVETIGMNEGDLIIFNSDDFISDSTILPKNRMALIGSFYINLNNKEKKKAIL